MTRRWRFSGKGPNGRNVCRWCGTEVPQGRHHWCGQDCVDQYLATKGHQHLIDRVLARDKGVCAKCGIDTIAYRKQRYRKPLTMVPNPELKGCTMPDYCLDGWDSGRRRWWEADHIVPCHEGGQNVLSNLQTLCTLCHKARTRQQAALRAQRRRTSMQPELQL
jgi:5-methylcytosine-specific restriction protein A